MLRIHIESSLVNCNSQFIELFGDEAIKENGWKEVTLNKLIEKPLAGEWGKEDIDGTGIKVLRTTNFTDDGVIDYQGVVSRNIDMKKAEKKFMRNKDILIEKSGGSDTKPVGRVVFYDGPDGEYLFNNFTAVLRVKNELVLNPRFLFQYLFVNYWMGGTSLYENKTTGIHNLKLMDYLSETKMPLPPIDSQNQFVDFVEQSDKSKFGKEMCDKWILEIKNLCCQMYLILRQ